MTLAAPPYANAWDAISETDLLRGRVSRFSLDALVNIATAIGQRVQVELTTA
ncbi:XRE family transcriptional regulator [Variovorax sp. J22R24]|uniref:XRE family transcriptional regulator n=1 Tax=Variovorax gracilis TaxID=3053502 RepID=UPI002575A0E2|nr:XRE family transcriptional regulator [Variovorax sp. J22R24]MDM0104024.1 XRE family transcriptional regulator [Variovorax sp. J22R24]